MMLVIQPCSTRDGVSVENKSGDGGVMRSWGRSVIARATTLALVLGAGGVALVATAPASHARGYADCYSASGSLGYGGDSYEVNIRDGCFPVSSSDEAFGKRVLYEFSFGYSSCGSRSGTLSVGSLGTSFRVSTSCLSPGSHRPELRFSSFSDGSSNFVYLSTIYISEPEPEPTYSRPTPTPKPSVRPTRPTSTPTPEPSSDSPYRNPGVTGGGVNPEQLSLDVRKTKRGAKVLQSSISPSGRVRALVKTRLDKGDIALMETSGVDPNTGRYTSEVTEVKVRKGGRVRLTTTLDRYNYLYLRDENEKLLVRWTTR